MNPDLCRRMRVLRARQRVEGISWRIHAENLRLPSDRRPRHRHVRARLMLLLGWAQDDFELERLRAVAVRLAWVYERSSDVLHGRRAYTDLPEVLVRAWESSIDEAELAVFAVLDEVHAASGGPQPG